MYYSAVKQQFTKLCQGCSRLFVAHVDYILCKESKVALWDNKADIFAFSPLFLNSKRVPERKMIRISNDSVAMLSKRHSIL